ncbi:MAG: InlB B-repeat-containing protein, partial [Clostridiales bacterium]|nr:InlB B-repeat-containing protein [Clostridiales bacterium]
YTLSFDANGGTISITPNYAQTTNGKLASLPAATAPEGKTFDGWYTAATGGTKIDTNTAFTQNTTVYAQYTGGGQQEESENYAMVGSQKFNLEETTISGAELAYTATVEMNEGDTVSFYIDGEMIEAWPGYIWNGLQKSVKASSFTAARAGTFEFNLGYYPEDEEGNEATWSVDGDDGGAPMLPGSVVTLKFSDATITLAFDLPGWATTEASIYVFSNGQPVGDAWPGTEMNGGEVNISANMGDCQIIISFQQDGAQKQTEDTDTTAFSDGGTYKVGIGDWTGDGVFKLSVEAV